MLMADIFFNNSKETSTDQSLKKNKDRQMTTKEIMHAQTVQNMGQFNNQQEQMSLVARGGQNSYPK